MTIPDDVCIENYIRGASINLIKKISDRINLAVAGSVASIGAQVELIDQPGDTSSDDLATICVLDSSMWSGTNNNSWHQNCTTVIGLGRFTTYTDISNPTYA